MGSLASLSQVEAVRSSVMELAQSQEIVYGDVENFDVIGADRSKGAFFSPILFRNNDPFNKTAVHDIEAFGPVATIMPYKSLDDAISLAKMGKVEDDSAELIKNLEKRLDNVVFRMGFADSRVHARQLVSHGFFAVNGKTVDIPSYQVKKEDVISLKENKKTKPVFKELANNLNTGFVS